MTLPAGWRPGRYPTPAEMGQMFETLEGYRVVYHVTPRSWSAVIDTTNSTRDGRWAALQGMGYAGSDDHPLEIYFERGSREVIVEVTERLTALCGPLVIVPDDMALPHLVLPGADPAEVLQAWDTAEGEE